MPEHDIIVIGTSAGGFEALQEVARGLPEHLPAAVFMVMHLSPRSRSFLPEILSRVGKLAAVHPADGAQVEPGTIYVAPPDHHLVIQRDHVHLSQGPKEQHHRPCINVTFRSAAIAYGERVVGVVLSGELDDGTAGLWEIKRRGGIAVVQNPEEAPFPSMPLSVLREVDADYTTPLAEIGPLLSRLVVDKGAKRTAVEGAQMDPKLTDLTCPDCRGTIWEVPRGNGKEYRCRVGHTFSAKSMLAEHYAAQEKALYAAVVALEEGASLTSRLADEFDPATAERLRAEAQEREHQAEILRNVLRNRQSFSFD